MAERSEGLFVGTGKVDIQPSAVGGVYQAMFGPLPDGTVYYDPMGMKTGGHSKNSIAECKSYDYRQELFERFRQGYAMIHGKALTTTAGGAGTAGNALIPVAVDPRIVDRSRKYTPWTEAIARVTNIGLTADYNIITAKGAAVTKIEDAALTEQDDTEDRQSKSIKYVYAIGRVTGPAEAAIPSYIYTGFQSIGTGLAGSQFTNTAAPNAMQYQVLKRARALKEKEEDLIWNGDSASDSTQFDGIVAQQSTTNVNDLATAVIQYADIEDSIQDAFDDSGRPSLGGASSSLVKDVRKIMIDTFRYTPRDMTATLPFGVTSNLVLETMVGPVPLIPSQNLSNVSGAKVMYFLDMEYIEMRVLLDMTFQELAQTNDSRKFMLKMYETLLLRSPPFNSFIDNAG